MMFQQQASMMGTAKPVFNQQTMGMAEAAFGNPAMRQASVGAAFQMQKYSRSEMKVRGSPRSLPNEVVKKMGYDPTTK